MNNNIIPACIIGAGLFYVGANLNKEQETKVIQAEPVVAKTVASSTGVGEPVIVWYGSADMGMAANTSTNMSSGALLLRAWSDGTVEAKAIGNNFNTSYTGDECYLRHYFNACPDQLVLTSDWFVISSSQMACRTDINGNGEIEFGDLLAVLNEWGTETTCPDVVQLQCGLMEMN